MSKETLEEWLAHLETIHPTEVELGLERVSRVAHALELIPVKQPVVTVAGTNGKGSTVAVLEALLAELGLRAGTFTSPHLWRYNERIRVAQQEATDAEIVAAFVRIDAARGETSLTYFEFAALAALLVFAQHELDYVILEVGLGGRLDAVNIVDASVAIITSIDLDHQGWLGDSRAAIAREKAGIMRAATPVIIADPEPPAELEACAAALAAVPALFLGREFTVERESGQWRGTLQQTSSQQTSSQQRKLAWQPVGSLLPENICAALQAALLLELTFSDEDVQRTLDKVVAVGRRQVFDIDGVNYLLDVAHNPAAVYKLLEYMDASCCNGKAIAIFSVMRDKDVKSIVNAAVGHFDAWFLADQPLNSRAAGAADVAVVLEAAGEKGIYMNAELSEALAAAQQAANAGDRIVVFGSFSTVAAVLPHLNQAGAVNACEMGRVE